MNKHESKYFSTAILMDEALISLLDKKSIEFITVKEICEKASVNRSTFYLHYESINDLLVETADYVNEKFISYFDKDENNFIEEIKTSKLEDLKLIKKEYLTPYLNFVKDNKKIFKASFSNPSNMDVFNKYNSLEKNIFIPILERFNVPEKDRRYLVTFYISGIMAIIKEWLKEDCKTDISHIVQIIIEITEKEV